MSYFWQLSFFPFSTSQPFSFLCQSLASLFEFSTSLSFSFSFFTLIKIILISQMIFICLLKNHWNKSDWFFIYSKWKLVSKSLGVCLTSFLTKRYLALTLGQRIHLVFLCHPVQFQSWRTQILLMYFSFWVAYQLEVIVQLSMFAIIWFRLSRNHVIIASSSSPLLTLNKATSIYL